VTWKVWPLATCSGISLITLPSGLGGLGGGFGVRGLAGCFVGGGPADSPNGNRWQPLNNNAPVTIKPNISSVDFLLIPYSRLLSFPVPYNAA